MKTLNEKIVRILLNHCEVLKHGERLIQVIPNGDIEKIADEIEQQVKSVDLDDVVGSLPSDEDIEEAACNYVDNKIYVSNSEKHDNCRQWSFEAGAEWMKEKVSGQ